MTKNKKKLIIISLLSVILIIVGLIYAYAKYITKATGTASADVADLVCVMSTPTVISGANVVNPYCTFTISDFDGSRVSEVSQNFQVTVTSETEGFIVPDYYWTDGNGNAIVDGNSQVIENAPLTGSFTHSQNGTSYTYRCVFINTGEEDISNANINLSLTATQAN